ncbi:MAG: adenylate/guanylate cyclase domain-containing protein, partial [Gammaproteobacteria bacterium]|nr:adenylate/guanylate cyclase domain-containing protein [Gammaproteobacteria bacterium]
SLFAGFAVIAARAQGVLEPLEMIGYDLGLAFLKAPDAAPPITLLAISESDIAALGRWPISDTDLNAAITRIAGYGPRVIGLDIYRDVPVPPGTDELNATLTELDALVGIFKFHSDTSAGVRPPTALSDADRVGFSDVVLDRGGIVRRGLAFLDDADSVAWAFALKLALAYLEREAVYLAPDEADPSLFKLGEVTFKPLTANFGGYHEADSGGYQFLIDFSQPARAFPRFSLADLNAGRIPPEALRDRIVLLGVDAESVKDSFATPLGLWPWSDSTNIPGIEVHARIADQLVRAGLGGGRPIAAWSNGVEWALILLACLAGGVAGLQSRSIKRLMIIAGGGIVVVSSAGLGLFVMQVWIPAAPMALGWLVASALVTAYLVQRTRHDRATLERILSLQVSPAVAGAMWQRRDELLEEGVIRPQNLTATVLFMDLQGFTSLSETLTSSELMAWLNPIMELATQTVLDHGGMVDDYFGDGIKANFGVPFARTSEAEIAADARNAVQSALALADGAERLSGRSEHPYRVRIGIHTGMVVTGSVGSSERMKYTSIGHNVNIAARLESFAKEAVPGHARQILISAATAQYVEDDFELRNLGAVTLKGKAQLTKVFQVTGLLGSTDSDIAPRSANEYKEQVSK